MKTLRYTSVLILALLLSVNAFSQSSFVLNEPAQSVKEKATTDATFYFTVNEEVFSDPEFKPGAEFMFNTGKETREFVVTRITEYIPGYRSIIAADKETGLHTFATTYHNGKLRGSYHRSHKEALKLTFDTDAGAHALKANAHTEDLLSCGVPGTVEETGISSGMEIMKKAKSSSYATAAPLNTGLDDEITIDLMIVYTSAAASWAATSDWGDIDGVITQAMTLSQQALDNSELNIELRLVHDYQTSYDETNDGAEDTDERLRRLTQNDDDPIYEGTEYNGYMQNVHDLRDQYGADVVAMFARISDTGGIGWRLGSSGGDSYRAFNINRVQQVAENYTLIHEIGHNMGNDHSRTQMDAEANGGGGLFQYSVGFQNESEGFHTVMAYDETKTGVRLTEIPYFSSPDLSYQGNALGTNDPVTPENSAMSMRQIKRSIAKYRPTVVDAPQAGTSTDQISVEMNREDNTTIPVTLTNSGASSLMWEADFSFSGNSLAKNKLKTNKRPSGLEPVMLENQFREPANFSGLLQTRMNKANEEIIYSTSFESNEGFSANVYAGIEEWRALTDTEFEISSANSRSGGQHFRVAYDDGNTQFIASPFFGYQTLGTYEVTINFSISDPADEVYDFYIRDGKTGGFSSGVIIASESIYYFDADESGGVTNLGGTETINANQYYNLRIRYNVANQSIDYYLNGNMVYQADYMQGNAPGVIQVLNRNRLSGSYMDVDDIEIKQIEAPYSWLDLPEMTGVVQAGGSGEVNLAFTTEGVSAGTYETTLSIRTNEPGNEYIDIPVTLTVNQTVPNEREDRPESISLLQNYPNPFNPATTIKYSLDRAQMVRLEVFNMQGQKVATIMQDQNQSAGEHSVTFDASTLSSGVYMYRLSTLNRSFTRQMILIK